MMPDCYNGLLCSSGGAASNNNKTNEHNELQQQQLPNQRVHSSYLPTLPPSRSSSASSSKSASSSSLLCSNFTKIDHLRIPDKLFVQKDNNTNNNSNCNSNSNSNSTVNGGVGYDNQAKATSILEEAAATMMMHPQVSMTRRGSSKRSLLTSDNDIDGGGCGSSKRSSGGVINDSFANFDDNHLYNIIHRKSNRSNTWPRSLVPSLTSLTSSSSTAIRFAVPESLFPPRQQQLNDANANANTFATATATRYYTSSLQSSSSSSPYNNPRDYCDDEAIRIASIVEQQLLAPAASSSSSRRKSYSTTPSQPSCLADPSYSSPSPQRRFSIAAPTTTNGTTTTTTANFFLLDEIREEVRSMTEGTRLVPLINNKNNPIIKIDANNTKIRTNKILGIGTFSTVTRVTIIDQQHQQQHQQQQQQQHNEPTNESTGQVGFDRRRDLRRPRYYACKSVKKSIVEMGENAVRSRSNINNFSNNNNNNNVDNNNQNQNEDNIMYRREYVNAIAQIANEIHVLSSFDHPNIIKIRGSYCNERSVVSSLSSSSSSLSSLGSFLLTDVLQETLDQRIERWKRNANTFGDSNISVCSNSNQSIGNNSNHSETSTVSSSSSSSSQYPHRGRNYNNSNSSAHHQHQHQMNIDKFDICLQLASALEYVHSRNVIYRDLKSSNVGFAADGTLQLFDFGLCVELTPSRQVAEGVIGTLRYMAPEVCLNQQYGLEADIYSFGIVAWEIWTNNLPYEELTPDLYQDWVCIRGYRPPDHDRDYNRDIPHQQAITSSSLHNEVTHLLSQTWKHIPSNRIRWTQIQDQLELFQQLEELRVEECELLC